MAEGTAERKARILFAATLVTIGLGAGGWYLFAASRNAAYQLITHEAVSGLRKDAPVEFHGVQVGKVSRVQLLSPDTIRIVIAVEKGAPVSTATRASIVTRGLAAEGFVGFVTIALDDAKAAGQKLVAGRGETLPTIPVVSTRDLSLDVQISGANTLVHELLDRQTMQSLQTSLHNLQQVTQALADNDAKLAALIRNSERASREVMPLLQSGGASIDAVQTQLLPKAYQALSDLQTLTGTLNATADAIRRDPSLLLRGRQPADAPGERR